MQTDYTPGSFVDVARPLETGLVKSLENIRHLLVRNGAARLASLDSIFEKRSQRGSVFNGAIRALSYVGRQLQTLIRFHLCSILPLVF
jgi:hypothetical protein